MWTFRSATVSAAVMFAVAAVGWADVFNMPKDLTSIETVPVGNAGNAADDPSPIGVTWGDVDYRIGKYEVTAGQYTEFLNAVAATDTYWLYNTYMADTDPDGGGCNIQQSGSSGSYTYSVAPDWANRPVNYVSWGDAVRFSNWLHNGQPAGPQDLTTTEDGAYYLNGAMTLDDLREVTRKPDWLWALPTEGEWYKAAYHKNDGVTGNYFEYPTSSDTMPGYVNNDGNMSGTGEAFVPGGTDPGNYATYNGDGGTDGIGPSYYRTEVGEWENSPSPYGTFDQGGNVWEWNEDIAGGWFGDVRGGSYRSSMPDASYVYYMVEATDGYPDIGFRVVQIPEPTVFLMLTVGGASLARRRRWMG